MVLFYVMMPYTANALIMEKKSFPNYVHLQEGLGRNPGTVMIRVLMKICKLHGALFESKSNS